MTICNKCGWAAADGLRFCTKCGTELSTLPDTEVIDRGTNSTSPLDDPNRARQTTAVPRDSTSPMTTQQITQQTPPPSADQSTSAFSTMRIPPTNPIGGSTTPQVRSGSSTGLVVVLTVIATVLILGGVGVGAWFLFGNKPAPPISTYIPPSTTTPPQNNPPANNPTPHTTPPPTTTPSTKPESPPTSNASDAKAEVVNTLNAWASSIREHDFDRQMGFYAPVLDFYYMRKNVSVEEVRANRIKAFERFPRMDVELGNVDVKLENDTKAAATFDKTWNFDGAKPFSGQVHQLVTLSKSGNRWLITGERDLLNYQR